MMKEGNWQEGNCKEGLSPPRTGAKMGYIRRKSAVDKWQ